MSNYFLYSFLDSEAKEYFRDFYQALSSYKRNFNFKPVSDLGFNLKFLGQDLPESTQLELEKIYNDFITTNQIVAFTHPLKKLKFDQGKITTRLKQSPDLHEFFRIVNAKVSKVQDDSVILPKDPNRRLGVIKLAEVSTNVSKGAKSEINSIVKKYPGIASIQVDNISLIKTELVRGKKIIRKLWSVSFLG